ncbi:MAG TPA: AAA family ATPase, partial [Candidatus Limnocylindrales bacterium]|nr:AAA family ATPase [Candidatus Limnocylindrales bacterium]
MIDCPRCSTPNAEGSRFCNNCGASLVTRVGVHERRIVTALFADLARSTSMGERLDPEVVRGVVGDFFELARVEIERRGGTVEKFSGDAVMAVFGLPQAHEDDPERAVRAALAIRDGLATLAGAALERHGITVQARIGIESGEVVVGDPFGGATMATGDAMNLAARLEQQADPGEVVVGEQAWDAVRDLVTAEALGELELRGHEAALKGWRVGSVATEVGRPRGVPGLQSPLTGRDEELTMLLDAADRAERERKAVLFTVIGVPGLGKSRLVRETADRLEQRGWSVVKGRCLPYGDGITYWPVQEMVRELAGIDADLSSEASQARLSAVAPDAEVADRLGLMLGREADSGEQPAGGGDREIAFAFRRLLEHAAATHGPMMLVFEDIHWAEPPLLDLIEHLVTWTRDVPLLVACPARPELIDVRPAWGSGRMEASRIMLEPLTEDESRALLGALLAVDDLPAELRQRVLDRAEGNPLFVEEVVRMLIEEGLVERRNDRWVALPEAAEVRVPDSVEALIRARLDTLPTPERATLQAAAVVGRIFQRSAVAAIAPGTDPNPLQQHLEDAILRDLITDERSADEPTFRFRHILIRDVAYATLPKARRAELHRGVAEWLRAWAGDRIDEFVEIEAYHLEQSVQLVAELEGAVDTEPRERAAGAMLKAGRRALGRDDFRAARSFAERALALDLEAVDTRLDAEALLIEALFQMSEFAQAADRAAVLEPAAEAAGRKDLQAHAVFVMAREIWLRLGTADADAARLEIERARQLAIEGGDDITLARALEYLGHSGYWVGDFDTALRWWDQLRAHYIRLNQTSREAEVLVLMARIYSQRVDPQKQRELLAEARELAAQGPSRLARARVERAYGSALILAGSWDEADEVLGPLAGTLEELGDLVEAYAAEVFMGDMDFSRRRLDEALAHYERALPFVMEHAGYRPEVERRFALLCLERGDVEAAERHAEEAVGMVVPDDMFTLASTRTDLGVVRERQGRLEEAEA